MGSAFNPVVSPVVSPVQLATDPKDAGTFTGILDGLGVTPLGVWDVGHRLTSSYSGPLIRLIRASDSAEQDFGFNADGTLDTASIATFLSATTGDIVTIYDQIGSNDLTQSTAAAQPLYSVTGFNSGPTGDFDGSNHFMSADAIAATFDGTDVPFTTLFPARSDTLIASQTIWCAGDASNNAPLDYHGIEADGDWKDLRRGSGTANLGTVDANTDANIVTHYCPGATLSLWANETSQYDAAGYNIDGVFGVDRFSVGAAGQVSNTEFWNGAIAGGIVFNSAIDTTILAALRTAYIALKGLS